MSSILSEDNESLKVQANAAGYATTEQYLIALVEQDAERLAIQEGLDAIQNGEVRSAEDAFARIRESVRKQTRS